MKAPETHLSHVDFTKTQLGVLGGIIVLTVDQINPVKVFLHVFPSVAPWHIVTICMLLSLYIWVTEFKKLLYYSVRIFFHSILSIFFREVEVIGRDKLPRYGPIIFTVNHANQFIDAVTLLSTCTHRVSYLMAEASYKRRIVGDLAWALDVVPVKRAQDAAVPGKGMVVFTKDETRSEDANTLIMTVAGTGTAFMEQLKIGDKIRPTGTAIGVKVTEMMDDGNMVVDGSDVPPTEYEKVFTKTEPNTFDVLKKIDQKDVYGKVLDKLASGGCIGIFPEGGSHDRTDLLPLKVGVALIAYSALEKDDINVPIVPVGLNYFRSHRWRGRATVEFGEPIYIDPSTLKDYKAGGADKRRVCNELLDRIQDSMRSVIVATPDYESLQLIHTARRLYQRKGLQGKEKQDMARRFAEGYKMLSLLTQGDPPERWLDLQRRMITYQKELRDLGIRDYQVSGLDREKSEMRELEPDDVLGILRIPYQLVHIMLLLLLAAIPTLFLNLPVGLLAGIYSERRRKKLLAKSKVKIRAYDVMLTEKVLFCIVAIPGLWHFYFLVLFFLTDFDGPTIGLLTVSLPVFAYMGIIATEAGMVSIKDIRPYYKRLFPSSRRKLRALPATRRQLQVDLRAFIKKVGPALGEIYYGKELNWQQIQERSRISSARLKDMAHDDNSSQDSGGKKNK